MSGIVWASWLCGEEMVGALSGEREKSLLWRENDRYFGAPEEVFEEEVFRLYSVLCTSVGGGGGTVSGVRGLSSCVGGGVKVIAGVWAPPGGSLDRNNTPQVCERRAKRKTRTVNANDANTHWSRILINIQ